MLAGTRPRRNPAAPRPAHGPSPTSQSSPGRSSPRPPPLPPGPIDDPVWIETPTEDAGGAELIRHDHPSDDTYHVVVYHAGGVNREARATAIIYLNGYERHRYENREIERIGRSWDVGVIDWSNDLVQPRNREGDGFPDP